MINSLVYSVENNSSYRIKWVILLKIDNNFEEFKK